MREKKFTRIAAFLLCLCTLLGNVAIVASATEPSDAGSSSLGTSSEELRELLNAISYQEYVDKNEGTDRATESVSVPLADCVTSGEGFELVKDDDGNVVEIITPQDGSITWTVHIPESAAPAGEKEVKFAIRIEYYPANPNDLAGSRATSIERILKINDEVPFSEARFLTIPKRWKNEYVEATLTAPEGMTLEELKTAAQTAGFTWAEIRSVNTGLLDDNDKEISEDRVCISFPDYFTADMSAFIEKYGVRFFQRDLNNNELRPSTEQKPSWMTYYLKDSTGYTTDNFEFVFEVGKDSTITLESQNEPMAIKAITLYPLEDIVDYATYIKECEGQPIGSDVILLEGEFAGFMSNKTIYPVEDRSCALNSPTDATCSVLNTIGGEKWATAGQWVEYNFQVSTSGMYDIVSRFRQNTLDGMYTCRSMYLYSDGLDPNALGYYNGAPFAEALNLTYDYSDDWQVTQMATSEVRGDIDTNGDGKPDVDGNGDGKVNDDLIKVTDAYNVYLEAGTVYTLRLEVTLGQMGDIVRQVEDILTTVNNAYLEIIKLTGINPDQYRDYGFTQVMPDVMISLVKSGNALERLAAELTLIAGEKSSNVATLEKVSRLLIEMGKDDDEVAKNLDNLKSYIGTLGTFLSDVRTQPLQLDYILIQPAGSEEPEATPGFFKALWHEVKGFFNSFFRDYNSMGNVQEVSEKVDSTEVWLATARDQSQVIRNLATQFTKDEGVSVNLKLVAAGTLLPSILAGSGPDVYLGLAQGDVINYAIRSALISIEDQEEDFDAYWQANFTESAMEVLRIEDADQQLHYYGLPETQSFPMMFVRIDVLADLGLDVPKTWDDVMACIPTLQANNMQIGMTTDYRIFLYQKDGDLFADDGMRINLDSQVALNAFEKMCNLFTMYSFPYQYDAANRFRTGEMPILLGDYTGTYNQLKVFATEIEGKWEFMPLPGETYIDENGETQINNVSISTVTATVMVKSVEERGTKEKVEQAKANAWKVMKWYTGADFQVEFSNEMIAILGPSAKQAVSNINALEELPWTTSEYKKVQAQFNSLGSVPNYPGAYIIDRYTNFAFLSAFNDNANPSEALMEYVATINKEIERKRSEFNLEILGDDYKDLLTKRLAQIDELAGYVEHELSDDGATSVDVKHEGLIHENSAYDSAKYEALMLQVQAAARSDDAADLKAAADAVRAAYAELDPDGTKYIADRNEVMGYCMDHNCKVGECDLPENERTTLDNKAKKKLRKCFIYEVYQNTDELYTQLRCLADFLDKAAELTPES